MDSSVLSEKGERATHPYALIPEAEHARRAAWIQTWSGRQFFPLDPASSLLLIGDIARALSNLCRYTGHCPFYSVAQHAVLCSYVGDDFKLDKLMHDASEAYLNDVSRPLKRTAVFAAYRSAEETLSETIARHFNLAWPQPLAVHEADTAVLLAEQRDLLRPPPRPWDIQGTPWPHRIRPLLPDDAEDLFLNRYRELVGLPHHGPVMMRLRRIGRALRRLVLSIL